MIAKAVFWISVGLILYTYAGYHIFLKALGSLLPSPKERGTPLEGWEDPLASIVLAVYNEAVVIRRRIQNLLELDYPKDRLEIIIASDGSTDSTLEIARRYRSESVTVLDLGRQGKGPCQNVAATQAKGEIIIFTDADTEFDRGFVRAVVRRFAEDPHVGCVAGHLRWKASSSVPSRLRDFTWGIEADLRSVESRLGLLASASGAAMAVRKSLWRPMKDALDDCDSITPLDVVLQGHRVVLAPDAIAYEVPFASARSDLKSKIRGVSKSVLMIARRWGFRNMVAHPIMSWRLISHHFLRWVGIYFMLAAACSSVLLFRQGVAYQAAVFFEVVLGVLALLGLVAERLNKPIPVVSAVFGLVAVNVGFGVGVLKGAVGAAQGPFETES